MEETRKLTVAEAHQYFAKTINSRVWELLQRSVRSQAEDDEMLFTRLTLALTIGSSPVAVASASVASGSLAVFMWRWVILMLLGDMRNAVSS